MKQDLRRQPSRLLCLALTLAVSTATLLGAGPTAKGWLSWRGPLQTGASGETGLPGKMEMKDALWSADFPGQSTAVIANGRLYILGYIDNGPDLQEGVTCFDAES